MRHLVTDITRGAHIDSRLLYLDIEGVFVSIDGRLALAVLVDDHLIFGELFFF